VFFHSYLITTVDQSSNQEYTGHLRSSKESRSNSTPESEETVHTQIGEDENDKEGEELIDKRERVRQCILDVDLMI
jgi:hypothetical protein